MKNFFFASLFISTVSLAILQADDKKQPLTKDGRFLGIGIDKNIEYSASIGKSMYDNKCARCHGEKGEKRAGIGTKKLTQMSGKEIFASFNAYLTDPSHGKASKLVMQPIASKLQSQELGYIIAYLKGEDDFIFQTSDEPNDSDIASNPTSQGAYIK